MKLTEYTLNVLKNFSVINSGVVLLPGTKQRTMSADQSILVEAELDEITDSKFGIYDLNQFLGNVTTLNNPDLTFSEKVVTMDDGSMQLTYFACSPEVIVSPPEDKNIELSKPDYEFVLTNAVLSKIKKLADMNNLPHLSVVRKDGQVKIVAHERKNDTSNHAATLIEESDGPSFTNTFKVENFKLIPDDYDVKIKHGAFAILKSKTKELKYVIAMESK